jgi:cysteine desulfurase/selenocysteine lyase
MIREVTTENVTYGVLPHKFEAGTPAIAEVIGLAAALNYIEGLGKEAIAAHEVELARYAEERLSTIQGLRLYGEASGKGPIVAFNLEGVHAHDVATVLDRSGIAVRAGTHCAQPLLARFGVSATCRASFALYNTRGEVDQLADAVARAQTFFQ